MTEAEQILQLRQECKEKSILLRQLRERVEKQDYLVSKADNWYKYFQNNPNREFTGKEIIGIMNENALNEG